MKLPNPKAHVENWNANFNLFSSEKCQLATEQRKGESLGVCQGVCLLSAYNQPSDCMVTSVT